MPSTAAATPSTTFWAPSTPSVQPFGVLHLTYDSYFNAKASYPIDLGLTMGVLPWRGLHAEVGFDLLYPTLSGADPVDLPILLNAKFGAPEDAYFQGQPAWSVGIYGLGLDPGVTNYEILYAMLGKTLRYVGVLQAGGYYGLNPDLLVSADGETKRMGLMAGWFSPPIDLPKVDKIVLAWDIQTGGNVLGATGGGVYVYLTPAIDILTGPVFFFEKERQPGGSSWMWSFQVDVEVALLAGGPALKAPASGTRYLRRTLASREEP